MVTLLLDHVADSNWRRSDKSVFEHLPDGATLASNSRVQRDPSIGQLLDRGDEYMDIEPDPRMLDWITALRDGRLQPAQEFVETRNAPNYGPSYGILDQASGSLYDKGVWKLEQTQTLGVRVLCRSSPGPHWIEAIYQFLAHGADPTIDLEARFGFSFLGALRSETQVTSNQGVMTSWFGIGKRTLVIKKA